jgi:hypothetical protein
MRRELSFRPQIPVKYLDDALPKYVPVFGMLIDKQKITFGENYIIRNDAIGSMFDRGLRIGLSCLALHQRPLGAHASHN